MAKVLVVDDEPNIRELLYTVLRRKGHQVLLADCGAKALELSDREHPQVIILDLIMPGMSGIDVLKQLKTLVPDVPVIILTGMGDEGTERQAQDLGALAFLKKSFSLHELGKAFNKALEQLEAAAGQATTSRVRNGLNERRR